jgi:hypothetical protein
VQLPHSLAPTTAAAAASDATLTQVHDGNALLIMDFGMCVRLPPPSASPTPGARLLVARQRSRGKKHYMSPEVWAEWPFDAAAVSARKLRVDT